MNRRDVLRALASVGPLGIMPAVLQGQGRTSVRYEAYGSGPALLIGSPITASSAAGLSAAGAERAAAVRTGYLERLTDSYRVILMDYPTGNEEGASFTPDRVLADILAVADAAGVDRFAWYGFSWGAVVGLQLATKTARLTALICGGWPPLNAPYAGTLAASETLAAKIPGVQMMVTYYQGLQNWREREAVSKFTMPRMVFAGSKDIISGSGSGQVTPIGPLIAEHREELQKIGWTVNMVEGFGHELVNRPDVVVPLIRDFLDPVLLRK